ncbi:MAG TPA: prepilin-type N-terminal cleavage/methylation domain-containing protein [Bacteroidota bacterium]|nr:prepilin-type N-terminal cleavage/methylation domain-containing protein [Bacteroidota bacterium]
MVLNLKNIFKKESGYTLIETLVAMALFLSVLIPMITMMGNLMFDRGVELKNKAFLLAISEMNEISSNKDFTAAVKPADHGLVIQRIVTKSESLVEVRVLVWSGNKDKELLVELFRTFLEYE